MSEIEEPEMGVNVARPRRMSLPRNRWLLIIGAPVVIQALYYDNLGNKTGLVGAVPAELQWAWGTKFWNLGANVKLE